MPTNERGMIFFDRKHRRKGVFRVFIILAASVFLFVTTSIVSAVFSDTGTSNAVTRKNTEAAYYYYHLSIHDKKIALTFDDGPSPLYTPSIIATLKQTNTPATFFMIGANVAKYPALAKEVADDGFVIGNHTYTHSHEVHASRERLALELRLTDIMIKQSTGQSPVLYRPPYLLQIGGDPSPNPEAMYEPSEAWSIAEGYFPVGADVDPIDWLRNDPAIIEEQFFSHLYKGGNVVLLHDGPSEQFHATSAALPTIIERAKKEGYVFVPVTALFGPTGPIAFSKELKSGDKGNEVSLLQWFLFTQDDMSPQDISGTFDATTIGALKQFQSRNKITMTGSLDVATQQAIKNTPLPTPHFSEGHRATSAGEGITAFAFSYPKFLTVIAGFALILALVRFSFLALMAFPFRIFTKKRVELPTWEKGVSVLVPAYNESANVAATITSVIASDYEGPMEIIVIDDGSSDDTAAFVRHTASNNPKYPITLITKKNGGKARALNIGFKAAVFEVVVAIDGDAILAPSAISSMARHFNDERVSAVAGKVYTAGTQSMLDRFQRIEYLVGQNIEKRAFNRVGAIAIVPGAIGAWRRDDVMEVGGFSRDTLVEDQDLTLALLSSGRQVRYEPRAIAYTETPHTVTDFLKQRFRWVYGTFQCFWKYKGEILRHPFSSLSLIVLPVICVYGMILPLLYPILDIALLLGIINGHFSTLLYVVAAFTILDVAYASLGLIGEEKRERSLILYVPLQRFFYRPMIWFVVMKSIVRAIEGTLGAVSLAVWNRVAKEGDAAKMYAAITEPITVVSASAQN